MDRSGAEYTLAELRRREAGLSSGRNSQHIWSMFDWLVSQFNPLFRRAQVLYGPAEDKPWKFGCIAFAHDGPHILFPEGTDDEVAIILNDSARNDPLRALYQLAHEIVHLLHINRDPPTALLEEGVAVHFSLTEPDYPEDWYRGAARGYVLNHPLATNYRDALIAYEALRELDTEAVKKIREEQSNLKLVTPELIKRIVPTVDKSLASLLCERRKMR